MTSSKTMPSSLIALFLLLSLNATAAAPFLLGFDYSEWAPTTALRIATDKTGAIYILASAAGTPPQSLVTKLSPDGKTIVWQNQLGFPVSSMTVDPNGGVYVAPINPGGAVTVAKLNDNSSGIAWTQAAGFSVIDGRIIYLAADADNQVYVAGVDPDSAGTNIVQLNTSGVTKVLVQNAQEQVTSLAMDQSGALYVAGGWTLGLFVTRYAPDGTVTYSTRLAQASEATVAVDANGNAVVYSGINLIRFDAAGKVTSITTPVPDRNSQSAFYPYSAPSLAVDASGNAYVLGATTNAYYPAKNSLAPCGAEFLSVVAPDGTILQTTYIPGAVQNTMPLVTVSPNGSVLLIESSVAPSTPTRVGPFATAGTSGIGNILVQLSPNANAVAPGLVCAVNGASFQTGSVSPGELITLFGNGIGPISGAQANVQTTLPTQLSDVQVTFDGVPAHLIWAQDSQINLVTPFGLQPGRTTQVCVTRGFNLGCLTLQVDQATPGVFTYDGTYAVALNQDGTLNSASNPASGGSIVSVFATGVGPIGPAQRDGSIIGLPLPTNTLSLSVLQIPQAAGPMGPVFAFFPANVTYSGPAPYRIAGISQINFRLGASSTSYVIRVGDAEAVGVKVFGNDTIFDPQGGSGARIEGR